MRVLFTARRLAVSPQHFTQDLAHARAQILMAIGLSGCSCHPALDGGGVPAAEPGARRLITTPNSDYPGFDYKTVKDVSFEDCSAQCLADGNCRALTYNTKAKWCFLKNGVGTLTQAVNATAAKVFETPPKPDIEAAPALPFVAPESLAAAEAYAKVLRETMPSAYADPAVIRANLDRSVTAKDYRGAVNLATQLVAFAPYDAALWRKLSEASGGCRSGRFQSSRTA